MLDFAKELPTIALGPLTGLSWSLEPTLDHGKGCAESERDVFVEAFLVVEFLIGFVEELVGALRERLVLFRSFFR
ncbi:hypothetical protein [Flaviflexus ciconiae]|uniref:hypothetical protein n=1 Tax=Flaviflexus ciconiae TaxID=2496867 RepID=UPI0013DFEB3D|nr:hypothetical protein [Flaviflexus ciconiae]